MLRLFLLLVGLAMLAVGLIGVLQSFWPPAFWFLIGGGLLTAGTLFEQIFYKPLERHRPGGNWIKTDERFVDPDSGKTVDVFYDPTTGDRRYVAQPDGSTQKSQQ